MPPRGNFDDVIKAVMGSQQGEAPVIEAAAPVYGATPVIGMSGGTPYTGTMDRSMTNMQQAQLLKNAIRQMMLEKR